MERPIEIENTSKLSETANLLHQWCGGHTDALEKLINRLFCELRYLAHRSLHQGSQPRTLETMDLVGEVYLRLAKREGTWFQENMVRFRDRQDFLLYVGQIMRNILAEYARSRLAAKRGGKSAHTTIDDQLVLSEEKTVTLPHMIALHQLLNRLEKMNPRQCRIIELQFYAGLNNQEIAQVLGISTMTVKRDRASAKCWLYRELGKQNIKPPDHL